MKRHGQRLLIGVVLVVLAVGAGSVSCRLLGRQGQPEAKAADPSWGEAVEGVQARLRAEKLTWMTNELPVFNADIRNMGQREFLQIWESQRNCQLQVDGQWYGWPAGFQFGRAQDLPVGTRLTDVLVSLSAMWQELEETELEWRFGVPGEPFDRGRKRLRLGPGRHSVRVAFVVGSPRGDTGEWFRAVSNPLEIEVKESPGPGTAKWPIDSDLAQALVELCTKHFTMAQRVRNRPDWAVSPECMPDVLVQAHNVEELAAGTPLQSDAKQFVESIGVLQRTVAEGDEQARDAAVSATWRAYWRMLALATGEQVGQEGDGPTAVGWLMREGVPRIEAWRQKRIDYVARMSLEEVADNLGDRNVFPAFAVPDMIEVGFWARALPANTMVLRLIEEGRKDPDRVAAILEKSIPRKIDELQEMWEEDERGHLTDPLAGQFAVAAGLYVLANIDRLDDAALLVRWIAVPAIGGYGKPYALQPWFIDYYFRATEATNTPYGAAHRAIVKDRPAPNLRHTRAKWNQPWEVHDPWNQLPSENVREPKRIEVLTIPFASFTSSEVFRIHDNWEAYVKQLEGGG